MWCMLLPCKARPKKKNSLRDAETSLSEFPLNLIEGLSIALAVLSVAIAIYIQSSAILSSLLSSVTTNLYMLVLNFPDGKYEGILGFQRVIFPFILSHKKIVQCFQLSLIQLRFSIVFLSMYSYGWDS